MAVKVLNYDTRAILKGDGFNAAKTANDAAMAVLVADGASPTQAHVTTANAALTALNATLTSGVTIIMETTITRAQLVAIFEEALKRLP